MSDRDHDHGKKKTIGTREKGANLAGPAEELPDGLLLRSLRVLQPQRRPEARVAELSRPDQQVKAEGGDLHDPRTAARERVGHLLAEPLGHGV